MFDKLHEYYHQSLLFTEQPNFNLYANYHWFKDEQSSNWLGIPFEAIQRNARTVLAFPYYEKQTLTYLRD